MANSTYATQATLTSILRRRAAEQPAQIAYTFLDGNQELNLSYRQLELEVRALAGYLQALNLVGQRALLLYPPGLDYVVAFLACLYGGVVAVPAYPPDIQRLERTLPRFRGMIADAEPAAILATSSTLRMAEGLQALVPGISDLSWVATERIPREWAGEWRTPETDGVALLQYTSGSTANPKGVMLTHANLVHNLGAIQRMLRVTTDSRVFSWLPAYHDMGLIGGLLEPLYAGIPVVLMSPLSFLQQPRRWLEGIDRHRTTHSGGPNFAYELCVRKVTAEEAATLDLSSWEVAFNGAEPVRASTLASFAERFAPCGFRGEAFYPCYGLAEMTVFATGGRKVAGPSLLAVEPTALAAGKVSPAADDSDDRQILVGCGTPAEEHEVVIADPETAEQCRPGQVGEIWLRGPSVAAGYWKRPEETAATFAAYLADGGEGPFLRTGDLGCVVDGEVYITGRHKDLIIVDGRNHYPQDIEGTVEGCDPALRPGGSAAFSITDAEGRERLVVVAELEPGRGGGGPVEPASLVRQMRQAVARAHDLHLDQVVLLKPRTVPKTSSGKIRRRACRAQFLADTLDRWEL